MKTRWIGVATTALAVGAAPAWAGSGGFGPNENPPAARRAAILTASAWDALAKGDAAKAVQDAEAATLLLPSDGGTRLLLGRAYLASGRFASAETAFGDALTLDPTLSRAAISRALAQIALDKGDAARASLAAVEGIAPDADIGLAEALLGDGEGALKRLDAAARAPGADARTRQNLGLVMALEGRWVDAVAIAQQDVPADLMPQRLRRWAMIAQFKADSAMQVGAILGVSPASDLGQPVALALASPGGAPVMVAATAAVPVVISEALAVAVPPASTTVAPIVHAYERSVVTQVTHTPPSLEALVSSPVIIPSIATPLLGNPTETAAPPVQLAVMTDPAPTRVEPRAKAIVGPPRMRGAKNMPARWGEPKAMPVKQAQASPVTLTASARPLSAKPILLASRISLKPVMAKDVGSWAVQLGAFSSAKRTEIAWGKLTGKAAFISAYTPTGSGQRWGKAMIYRLSVSGLPSRQEAVNLCMRIKAAGGVCFVRGVRGDRPMQWAERSRGHQST